jgi:hypothetical protein
MASKIRANALVDLCALISFIPMLVSGVVLFGILPSGGGGYKGGAGTLVSHEFIGLTRFDWVAIHDWTGFIFAVLVAIHLVLHWRFMKNMHKYIGGARKEENE